MIKINFEKECYGCGVCAEVCPKQCIAVNEDEKGFLKAFIDESNCIDCGRCDKVCIAEQKNESQSINALKTMYGYNTDSEKRNAGTSGGVFSELANACFKNGYLIAGCVWGENWKPKHILTDNWEMVLKMQRSKYAQSDLHEVLNPIKAALKDGKRVLFSGTPCQIAAVRKFIGESDRMLYVGVVCHGVASRRIWRMYLDSLEQENGKISELRMREKVKNGYSIYIEYESGKTIILSHPEDGQFLQCYKECLFLSERCHSCQYKGENIYADIIIGDGWVNNSIARAIDDGLGLSCILIKSERGKTLWNEVCESFLTMETTADIIVHGNPRLVTPSKKNSRSKRFYKDVNKHKKVDSQLLDKYMVANAPINKIKRTIRKIIKR